MSSVGIDFDDIGASDMSLDNGDSPAKTGDDGVPATVGGGQGGSKNKKKPQNVAGSSNGSKREVVSICFMPKCQNDQKRGNKWCPFHNCHYENMRYEKEHNKKDGSKENKDKWVARMKDDIKMLYRRLGVSPTKKCCVSFRSAARLAQ